MKWKNFWAKLLLLLRGRKTRGMGGPAADPHNDTGTSLDEYLFR